MTTPDALHVHVDPHKCEGHGLCLQIAPEVFDLTDDEIAFCAEYPDPAHLHDITAAAAACPQQAITVEQHQSAVKDAP